MYAVFDAFHAKNPCMMWDSETSHVALSVQNVDSVHMLESDITRVAVVHVHSLTACIPMGRGWGWGLEGTPCGDFQCAHVHVGIMCTHDDIALCSG